MNDFEQKWQPRPGGWERLNAKISASEENKRREVRIWSAAAMIMLVLGTWVASFNSLPAEFKLLQPPPAGTVRVAGAAAVEIPGMAPGVHYFWIAR